MHRHRANTTSRYDYHEIFSSFRVHFIVVYSSPRENSTPFRHRYPRADEKEIGQNIYSELEKINARPVEFRGQIDFSLPSAYILLYEPAPPRWVRFYSLNLCYCYCKNTQARYVRYKLYIHTRIAILYR